MQLFIHSIFFFHLIKTFYLLTPFTNLLLDQIYSTCTVLVTCYFHLIHQALAELGIGQVFLWKIKSFLSICSRFFAFLFHFLLFCLKAKTKYKLSLMSKNIRNFVAYNLTRFKYFHPRCVSKFFAQVTISEYTGCQIYLYKQ